MALAWKVVSQRNWLKGLQATFGRFSQPTGILRRISNLLYDKRGALRTSDGSFIFASPNFSGPLYGPTLDHYLYQPKQVNAYYLALQKSVDFQVSLPTGVTLTAVTIGGAVSAATRTNGNFYTVTVTGGHNLAAVALNPKQVFQPGSQGPFFISITIAGVFVGDVGYDNITIVNANTFTFQQGIRLPNSSGSSGTVGTALGLLGTYTYDVTANDGVGGETPPSGSLATITLVGSQNAVIISWNTDPAALFHSVYRTAASTGGIGRLNLGSGPNQVITSPTFVDLGQPLQVGATPPTINTTQTLVFRIITASYGGALAVFPTSLLPLPGGILGAVGGSGGSTAASGLGPTPNGGVVGNTGPLAMMTEFANQMILALGNGYAPQTYLDGTTPTATGNTGGGSGAATFSPSGSASTSASVSQSGSGSATNTSSVISGFPSQPVTPGSVSVIATFNGSITASQGGAGAQLEISGDSGATWSTFYSFGSGSNQNYPSQTVTIPAPATIANLNTVQIRIVVNAQAGPSGSASVTALITTCSLSIPASAGSGGGVAGAVSPLQNNFTAAYPDWQASVAWNPGDTIRDSVSGGIFKTTNGGESGPTRPAFVNVINQNTPDTSPGTVTWTCIATAFVGTPLRGAAHVIVYAGALWLLNTWPYTTSDQQDGPCCIKMSDINNPSSWNPVNVAFLDRDDGDEITGAATFTIAQSGIAPTGSLVIFKYFKTYQLTGVFGATDLTIQQAQTSLGCIAPRSIQFLTGFGISRLCHLGFAYFNGVNDKLFSEEIRPYLFEDPTEPDIVPVDWSYAYFAKGAQSATPPMYICAMPLLTQPVSGVTVVGASAGNTYAIYVRVVQLLNEGEIAISGEMVVQSATNAVTINTPAASAGITYRVYVGNSANGENLFVEQASFTNQTVTLASMTPGFAPLGLLTRLFCYDLVMRQWAIVDLPFAISAIKNIRAPGTVPLTTAAGYSDGDFRRLFAGDPLWDTGSQVQWSFTGGELFQDGGTAKVYYRRLVLRGRFASTPKIQIAVNLDGGIGTPRNPSTVNQLKPGFWDIRLDILADAESASATVSGSGAVEMVVESMDWHLKPKPAGAPVSLQR